MKKVYTIKVNNQFWPEERLIIYVSEKFKLPRKMNLQGYRLNRILCHNAMANLHDRDITKQELDKFLTDEYKKLLLEEKESLTNTQEKEEIISKKM